MTFKIDDFYDELKKTTCHALQYIPDIEVELSTLKLTFNFVCPNLLIRLFV